MYSTIWIITTYTIIHKSFSITFIWYACVYTIIIKMFKLWWTLQNFWFFFLTCIRKPPSNLTETYNGHFYKYCRYKSSGVHDFVSRKEKTRQSYIIILDIFWRVIKKCMALWQFQQQNNWLRRIIILNNIMHLWK